MKTRMFKRILSLVLALMISLTFAETLAFADKEKTSDQTTNIPTFIIHGQGSELYKVNNDKTSGTIYPFEIDIPELLKKAFKELNTPFLKALITGNWDDWCEKFIPIATEILSPIALDENGEVVDGSGYKINQYFNKVNYAGTYNYGTYMFYYDWRRDPCAVADDLYRYAEGVARNTSKSSADFVGRCIGGCVLLAYLGKYGNSTKVHPDDAIFYCTGFEGMDSIGRLFSGKIFLTADGLNGFLNDFLTYKYENTEEFKYMALNVISSIAYRLGTYHILCRLLNKAYLKIYDKVIPAVLLQSFGTMPSFWSMVGDEYYEDAKEFVFGDETEKYKVLIEKIDNFHYNYLLKYKDIIETSTNQYSSHLYNIAKYGKYMVPITDDKYVQSDNILQITSASPGTVTANVKSTLSEDYILNVTNDGNEKYISPDKKIDASGAMLRDHTWYIKNLSHKTMPNCINELILLIVNSENYTSVTDSADFPQFLYYNVKDGKILPQK